MDVLKLRKQLFGSLADDVGQLGDACLSSEAYANAVYDLFEKSSMEDSPAADLFRREKWHDLFTLLYPELPPDAIFTGTCMRRAVAAKTDQDDLVGRILTILDNDCGGEVVTRIVSLQEAGGWDALVKELVPTLPAQPASDVAWRLKRIAADPDGLIDAIDADGTAGKITPRDAVDRLRDVYFGERFLRTAVEDLVTKLLPKVPAEFRAGCAEHFFRELARRQTVVHVTEAPTAPPPAPVPEVTAEDIEQAAWTEAQASIERLAKMVRPLTEAGLSSSDALDAANTAIGVARQQAEARADRKPEPSPFQSTVHRSALFAGHYGATILGGND